MNNIENMEKENGAWLEIIKHYLKKEETIQNILKLIDQPSIEIININKPYTIGNDRVGVIAQIKNPDTKETDQLIIDVRHGGPSYLQLLDIVFDVGADCKSRILIFDDEVEDHPSHYKETLKSYVHYVNRYNARVYLFLMDRSIIAELSCFYLLMGPPEKSKFNITDVPDKEQFQKAEFLYFYFNKPMFSNFSEINFLGTKGLVWEGTFLTTYFKWDERGAISRAIDNTSDQMLKKILDAILPELKDAFKGKKIIIEKPEYGPAELMIIHDNRSVHNFYHLPLQEKERTSVSVINEYYTFSEFMEKDYSNEIIPQPEKESFVPFQYFKLRVDKIWNNSGAFLNVGSDLLKGEYYLRGLDEEDYEERENQLNILNIFSSEIKLRIPDCSVQWVNGGPMDGGISITVFGVPFSKISRDQNVAKKLFDLFDYYQRAITNLLEDIRSGKECIAWKKFDIPEEILEV